MGCPTQTAVFDFWILLKIREVEKGILEVGNQLLLQSGEIVAITELEWVHLETTVKVYNFEVRDWHTYFVSELDVLVHNKAMWNDPDEGGLDSFRKLKKSLGAPGKGKDYHHIVEQSQIKKAGFSAKLIHNPKNAIAISKKVHRKISGFYSSKPKFAKGLRVRDWLSGKSFEEQFRFGQKVLKMFGVEQ